MAEIKTKINKRHLNKWTKIMKEATTNSIKNYSSDESFYQGDVIDHHAFGQGRVQSSFGNKIEVIFQDKMRILIHKLVF